MKITLTKQETHELLKKALCDYHPQLIKEAGFGYLEHDKFDVEISTYNDPDYLTVTKHVEVVKKEDKK